MRRIFKKEPLQCFKSFLKQKHHQWEDFAKSDYIVYLQCREFILNDEQGVICAYTELPLDNNTHIHIDHYKKRELFPNETFNWDNLLVALKEDDFGANYKDNIFKIRKKDYPNILNPVIDDVQHFFRYSFMGDIEPKSDLQPHERVKAQKTIDVFNLNHPSLVNRRKGVMLQIQSCKKGNLSKLEMIECFQNTGFKSLLEQELERFDLEGFIEIC